MSVPDAVHFWFDLADPWSWLAMDEVRRVAQEAGRPVMWHPVRLEPPTSYTNPAREAIHQAKLERAAASRGLPVPHHELSDQVLVEAMAAIHQVPAEDRGPIAEATLRAVWTGAPTGTEVAAPAETLADATREAEQVGVFATPSVAVDDVVFWGLDRLHFVRRAVGLPASVQPFAPAAGAVVRWFHDLSSPFSYLASTQIARWEQESGVSVERVPILLGALFRDIGTPMVPLATFSVPMQRWALRDLMRWAEWWGVPFHFTDKFPLRTIAGLRVAAIEPSATDAMYRAAWADNLDIGDEAVLAKVLDDAGFDGAGLLARTKDPAVKAQLRQNTEAAQARGVCGVPTFEVGDTLLWGQDQLVEASRLAGAGRSGL